MTTILAFVRKNLPLLIGVLVIVGGLGFLLASQQSGSLLPMLPGGLSSEGTGEKRELPPEPAFSVPANAARVDDYSYTLDGAVFLRSLTSNQPLQVPGSDGASFERVTSFRSYNAGAVLRECGAAPQYTYYADDNQVYFYQLWRAPEFRSSRIEVIVRADKEDFSVDTSGNASDSEFRYTVGYEVATSTCWLNLSKTAK